MTEPKASVHPDIEPAVVDPWALRLGLLAFALLAVVVGRYVL